MNSFWNPGQKELIGNAFIPENKQPIPAKEAPFVCSFNWQGNAYRKAGHVAWRIDNPMEKINIEGGLLIFPQTNTKPIFQDAYGVGSHD